MAEEETGRADGETGRQGDRETRPLVSPGSTDNFGPDFISLEEKPDEETRRRREEETENSALGTQNEEQTSPDLLVSLSPLLSVSSPSPWADAARRLRRNPVVLLFGGYLALLLLASLFAPWIAHWDYAAQDYRHYNYVVPSSPDARHVLGTDPNGRDLLARLLYGARVSLGVGVMVVVIEALIGVPLGLIAGYRGGRTDTLLMRLTDVMFAFPDILLAILLAAVIRSGMGVVSLPLSVGTLFFSLGVVGWPGVARLVRGQTLGLRNKEYVEAARAIGASDRSILWRHLFPNLLSPLIVQITQDIANVILAEAALAFLGLGVQPPYPSWGRMISESIALKEAHPMLLIWPSLLLALTVMAFNFLGDALRDALDPRLRQ